MAYIQLTVPKQSYDRKSEKAELLLAVQRWAKENLFTYEVDVAGFELNFYFSDPVAVTVFLMNPPELSRSYIVIP
jgi:hypothetical protein